MNFGMPASGYAFRFHFVNYLNCNGINLGIRKFNLDQNTNIYETCADFPGYIGTVEQNKILAKFVKKYRKIFVDGKIDKADIKYIKTKMEEDNRD